MDGSKDQPNMTAGLDTGDKYPTSASSNPKQRGYRGGEAAYDPRGLQTKLRLPAAHAHGNRGRNPLAVGKQG